MGFGDWFHGLKAVAITAIAVVMGGYYLQAPMLTGVAKRDWQILQPQAVAITTVAVVMGGYYLRAQMLTAGARSDFQNSRPEGRGRTRVSSSAA